MLGGERFIRFRKHASAQKAIDALDGRFIRDATSSESTSSVNDDVEPIVAKFSNRSQSSTVANCRLVLSGIPDDVTRGLPVDLDQFSNSLIHECFAGGMNDFFLAIVRLLYIYIREWINRFCRSFSFLTLRSDFFR